MKRHMLGLVCGMLLLAGCGEPTGYAGSDNVELRVMNLGVEIENNRSRPIYFFIADASAAARILWGPCDVPNDNCPTVAADSRVQLGGHSIPGWGESEETILYWWHLIPSSSGKFRVDSVRHIVAKTR